MDAKFFWTSFDDECYETYRQKNQAPIHGMLEIWNRITERIWWDSHLSETCFERRWHFQVTHKVHVLGPGEVELKKPNLI